MYGERIMYIEDDTVLTFPYLPYHTGDNENHQLISWSLFNAEL